jgi:flagellar motility protein MotE (MotC chaperone)
MNLRRLRLVDAVIIAAIAMLCLKILGLVGGSHASDVRRTRAAAEERQEFGAALAKARTNFDPEVKATGTVPASDGSKAEPVVPETAHPVSEPAPIPASAAERALLERLGERREQWQQKGRDLDLRERLLEDAERKLEARINDLKAMEEKAGGAKDKGGGTESAALKNLVTMYETMKPKEAARVFDRLTHEVLVPVVLQMNPRKMAEVLAVMSPEAAERLTVALAMRAKSKGGETAGGPGALPANELPAIEPVPR